MVYQIFQITYGANKAVRDLRPICGRKSSRSGLVGCALRHDDKVDATVSLFLSLFRRSFTGASGNSRSIHALLDDVLLGEIGASLRQLGGLGFLLVRETYDDQLGVGIILQTQSDVVTHALAGIVKARRACLVVSAIACFGGLRRRRRLLHINAGRSIGSAAAAVAHRALHGIAAGSKSGRVKLPLWTIAGHLAASRGIAVSQRIAVRIAGHRSDTSALFRHNRAAVGRARNGWGLIRFLGDRDVSRASCSATPAVVHFRGDGIAAFGKTGGVEARIRAGAFYGPARRSIAISQRVIVRIAGGYVDRDRIVGSSVHLGWVGCAGR